MKIKKKKVLCTAMAVTVNEIGPEYDYCHTDKIPAIKAYNNIIKWAEIYENADFTTKQIIVAHLIDSITVKKGYELTVNFKISLEQFENGLEFQALSS